MTVGLIEVRKKFASEVSRRALQGMDKNTEANIVDPRDLALPILQDIVLEPIFEWKMGVAGTTTTTTTPTT